MNPIDLPCRLCHAPPGDPCLDFDVGNSTKIGHRGRAHQCRVDDFKLTKHSGYHLDDIDRGKFGEVSKIEEEFHEFMDATQQGVTVMQLVELSDLLGAIEGWLEKYHPNITLNQLCKMKDVTRRAFKNGHRKSR